ncbi:MAG: hypothetical protein Q8Q03_00190 [bacterium]|nr:hypothetical protein [bacterium]
MRIIAALIMIACILWGYWWLMLSAAIIFLFIFNSYYEIIAWGIIYDSLYGVTHMFAIAAIILFMISFFLKKYLFAYAK